MRIITDESTYCTAPPPPFPRAVRRGGASNSMWILMATMLMMRLRNTARCALDRDLNLDSAPHRTAPHRTAPRRSLCLSLSFALARSPLTVQYTALVKCHAADTSHSSCGLDACHQGEFMGPHVLQEELGRLSFPPWYTQDVLRALRLKTFFLEPYKIFNNNIQL